MQLTDREIEVVAIKHPDNATKPFLGLSVKQHIYLKEEYANRYGDSPWLLYHLSQLLFWVFALNLGIGLINLLPLGIVDGGRMLGTVLGRFKNKRLAGKIFFLITLLSVFILLFNLIGPYFKGLIL